MVPKEISFQEAAEETLLSFRDIKYLIYTYNIFGDRPDRTGEQGSLNEEEVEVLRQAKHLKSIVKPKDFVPILGSDSDNPRKVVENFFQTGVEVASDGTKDNWNAHVQSMAEIAKFTDDEESLFHFIASQIGNYDDILSEYSDQLGIPIGKVRTLQSSMFTKFGMSLMLHTFLIALRSND